MRKKLAAGGLAVLGVIALGVGGTYAAFSDSEQGPNILVEAGKLDLVLSAQDEDGVSTQSIRYENFKPGDEPFYFVKLTNNGTVTGKVKWAFENHQELENECGVPEQIAGDDSCRSDEGELGSQLAVMFTQMSGVNCEGSPHVEDPVGFSPAFSLGRFTSINGLALGPQESKCVRVSVRFNDLDSNNRAQSDSSIFGFRFQLVS